MIIGILALLEHSVKIVFVVVLLALVYNVIRLIEVDKKKDGGVR